MSSKIYRIVISRYYRNEQLGLPPPPSRLRSLGVGEVPPVTGNAGWFPCNAVVSRQISIDAVKSDSTNYA